MKIQKKDGGLIKNWQAYCPKSDDPESLVFLGIVVEDAAGRYQPGDRIRSSRIVSIDRDKGVIETQNTLYRVIHEIQIHEKGQYKFVRISDLQIEDQKKFKKFLLGRNTPIPPGEAPGDCVWPSDFRAFARGTDPAEGFF